MVKALWLCVIKTTLLCKTMKKAYFKPALVVEPLFTQSLICGTGYEVINPDDPDIEAGARSIGGFEADEESGNFFGSGF